jgi:hypothetical protein
MDVIAVGESQDCSWAARGWVRSLFLVLFWYLSKAVLKTNWKFEVGVEVEGVGATWDIGLVGSVE